MKISRRIKKISIIFCIIIFLSLIIYVLITLSSENLVKFKKNIKVEINSNVYVKDFIIDKKRNVIIKNTKIDTTNIGEKNIHIKVKRKNLSKNINLKVNVVDEEAPVINLKQEKIEMYVGDCIDLFENVSIKDNSGEKINPKIKGKYDFDVIGKYVLMYTATDSSGNTSSKNFILNVKEDDNNKLIITKNGFKLKIRDGLATINGTVIANKSYRLPKNYGNGLTKEMKDAFVKMSSDAKKRGLNIFIISGFRSYDYQYRIYNNYVVMDGKEAADRYSSRPGYSEHQTGLTIDVNSLNQKFEFSKEGKWINDNAYKYGFILRYPKGKEKITGYLYEPWHFRYVGTDLAKKLYNNGNWLALEEYFGIDSVYKD